MASTSAANGSINTRVASPTNESAVSGHSIAISVTSPRLAPSSTIHKKVVTAPPWARHEPPSPQASTSNFLAVEHSPSVRSDPPRPFDRTGHGLDASDVASSHASTAEPSHWWTFNIPYNLPLPLPLRKSSTQEKDKPSTSKANTIKERSRTAWLFDRAQGKANPNPNPNPNPSSSEDEGDGRPSTHSVSSATHGGSQTSGRRRGLRLHFTGSSHLAPPFAPFTLRQNQSPGWETPWAPIPRPDDAHIRPNGNAGVHTAVEQGWANDDVEKRSVRTGRRRKTWKTWLLTNNYVPLIIRLLNITFTTATLAIAITIRKREKEHNLVGVVGSSPVWAIIFAPPTLIHVMVAVYLEYFGKPLGLWSTSAKLLHTVSEMFFIAMWSASLSLCFDNYFTSPLQCVPESATYWWNHIERTAHIPTNEESVGDQICDDQVALICVVFAGLVLYCSSLIISLFRIFEKVKYHGDRSTV